MRVSDQTIESILKQGGVIDEPQLADLKLIAERSKQTLQETAIEQKVISEEDLDLIQVIDKPEDVVEAIFKHYESRGFGPLPCEREMLLNL